MLILMRCYPGIPDLMKASASLWDVMRFDGRELESSPQVTGLDPRADRRAPFRRTSSSARPQGWRVRVGWLPAILLGARCPYCTSVRQPEPVRTTGRDVRRRRGSDPARDRGGSETDREMSTSPGVHAEERATAAGKSSNWPRRCSLGTVSSRSSTTNGRLATASCGAATTRAAAIAAVALLATRRDVDPSRLGLWAQSEGAYVAPLACRRSSAIKFVITVGATG